MNAGVTVNRMYGLLDATSAFTLVGWTDADLYALVNDSIRRICLDTAIIGTSSSISVSAGATTSPIPSSSLAVLDAAFNGDGLEIVEVRDFDNEEVYWQSTPDYPTRVTFEQFGQRTARFNRTATNAGTLQLVHTSAPPTLDGFTTQPTPELVDVVCLLESVASARRQDGLYQQLDTAESLQGFADLLKDSLRALYGRAA